MQAYDPVNEGLSVVLPAYNEAENLGEVVSSALKAAPAVTSDFEVIIVDDGSTDDTLSVATALVEEHHPRVRLFPKLNPLLDPGPVKALLRGRGYAQVLGRPNSPFAVFER